MLDPLLFGTVLLYLALCAFTLKQRPLKLFHWYFCILVLAFCLWSVSLNIYYYNAIEENVLFWGRFNYAVAIWIALGISGFFYFFPRKTISISIFLKWLFLIIIVTVFFLTLFTPLIDQAETLTEQGPIATLGKLYFLYLSVGILGFGATFIVAIQKLKKLDGLERRNFNLVFQTFFITVIIFFISNGILPIFPITQHLQYTFLIPLPISLVSFYAILRYRFLDIKFAITQTLKQVIAFGGSLLSSYILYQLFHAFFANNYSIPIQALIFWISLNIYLQLIKFFHSNTFHRFFGITPIEHFQKVLYEFKNANTVHKNLNHLQQEIQDVFCKKLHIQSAKLILCSDKIHKAPSIKAFFKQQNSILVTKETLFSQDYSKQFKTELTLLGEVVVPLFRSSHNPIGVLVLGEKRFDDPYSREEITMLKKLEGFLSLSLTGILYTQQLQDEVNEKTRALKEKNIKLQELDKTKDDFISIASHELRTPLTVIKGYSSFLLDGEFEELNPHQKEAVQDILHNSEELIVLVNKMLDISRLEAGKMEFNITDVPLKALLEEVTREFQFICTQKDISLSFNSKKNTPKTIKTDSEKIKRILINLLGNAYKFTPNKGHININLQQHPENEKYVLISVQDTGIGIPKDRIPFIFEKFQQVQNLYQKTYSGTGLGLSIVKGILEKLGGKIWIESIEKKGSTFFFSLPKTPHL